MADFHAAEVRNIMDPLKSGRVQIRIYGLHDDEKTIKDADLPWALPLMPSTSASTGKVGVIPTGLIVGSRVIISFLKNDTAQQYPIIFGSFGRGGMPK
jgi:hypothetical protein